MNRRIDLINQTKCCLETESIAKVKKEISTFAGGDCGCGGGCCCGEGGCCCAVCFWKSLENMVDRRGGCSFFVSNSNYQAPTDMTEMIRGFSSEFFLKMNGQQSWWLVGLFACLLSEVLPRSKLHGAFSCV